MEGKSCTPPTLALGRNTPGATGVVLDGGGELAISEMSAIKPERVVVEMLR